MSRSPSGVGGPVPGSAEEPGRPRTRPDRTAPPDSPDPDDAAGSPETLGIDNTDTALGAEDDSTPEE